uniref:Peroxin/Ferlin domain-containing protein n=1 Tax=Astyanax mexicanus TaxID=7994 RepID=A0A8B9HMK8_ASTMX
MPGSLLWAVDVYGRVFRLCSTGGRWERSKDVLLELKRVTAAEQGCWGIGCDHQVYLNVLPSDVAIRHQEETYENQRWNPVEGYTDTLLPTDRWQWTDESGQKPQPLHSFHLPSDNWEWEGDWYVDDESCGRESTATGGWEYAVDFPATFTKEKKWNSCVRRRRWLRYRRYKARGSWAKFQIEILSFRPENEKWLKKQQRCRAFRPQIIQGKQVWFRTGVKQQNPEGTAWENIPVPKEVSQISAGPGDLLWAVLWDGQLLVRTGISKDCPKGLSLSLITHFTIFLSVIWLPRDSALAAVQKESTIDLVLSGWVDGALSPNHSKRVMLISTRRL